MHMPSTRQSNMYSVVSDNKMKCSEEMLPLTAEMENVEQTQSRHSDFLNYSKNLCPSSIRVKVQKELSPANTNLHSVPDISSSWCCSIFQLFYFGVINFSTALLVNTAQ